MGSAVPAGSVVPATGGRHALRAGTAGVRVADLLSRTGARSAAWSETMPSAPVRAPRSTSPNGTASALERQRDWLVSELTDARIETDNMRALLNATVRELTALREGTDKELAAQRAEHEDRQTWWELRVLELEKDVAELTDELDERTGADSGLPASAVAGELERLRVALEQARAEAADASAEADAAFAELRAAYAALSAVESQLTRRLPGRRRR